MVPIDLQGEIALVTGGGRGIGAAVSVALAAAGAKVVVTDIDQPAAIATAASLGDGHLGLTMDVTDDRSVAAAVEAAAAAAGPATILVSNAFFAAPGPFLPGSPEADGRTIEVILGGALRVARATLPAMIGGKHGRVITVASEAGRVGEAGMVAYSAAKAGVIGLTRALAKEVGRHQVTVNAVSPGATRTQTTLDQLSAMGADPEQLARQYPLRRLGEPEDIAGAVLWLASSLASWVTGQVIGVSGGFVTA
jgi:NAD(P)-dependent dehydrogenase (short-subunit alcohol dehydrogenase family)